MQQSKQFIPAAGYNWLTGLFDLGVKITLPEKQIRNRLIDQLHPKDNELILEFGFGTAQNLILAYQRNKNATYHGLDIDPKIYQIARKKINKLKYDIHLDLYDGFTFPYADNSFDKIFSCLVFHQLDRETKVSCLQEIERVLKPNGKMILADFGKAKNRTMRFLFYAVQLLDGFRSTGDNVKGLIPQIIEQSGLHEVTEIDCINTRSGSFSYYRAIKAK